MQAFWDVMAYRFVNNYRRFEGKSCLQLEDPKQSGNEVHSVFLQPVYKMQYFFCTNDHIILMTLKKAYLIAGQHDKIQQPYDKPIKISRIEISSLTHS
jgi:hypothetical protein